jgi:hypothetical protein
VSNRKLARKGNKGSGPYKPWLIATAFALFWAGLHEPAGLTPATLLIWLLSAVTAGVLVRAALAVTEPLVKLAADVVVRTIRETDAEEP